MREGTDFTEKSTRKSNHIKTPLFPRLHVAAFAAVFLILANCAIAALEHDPARQLTDKARQNASVQIEALRADKAKWTKAQKKMDSQFIMAARFKAKGIVHPAAPKLRPSLTAQVDGRYAVEVKGTVTPELLAAIKAAGGTITSSFPAYHVVRATLPVENIESIAGRPDVVFRQAPPSKATNNSM